MAYSDFVKKQMSRYRLPNAGLGEGWVLRYSLLFWTPNCYRGDNWSPERNSGVKPEAAKTDEHGSINASSPAFLLGSKRRPCACGISCLTWKTKASDQAYIWAALAGFVIVSVRGQRLCVLLCAWQCGVGLGGVLFDAVAGINRMFDDKEIHRLTVVSFSVCVFV